MHLNSRAVRHSYEDKLVPRLTVNGFGPLINCDEWELIHNPLCSWPCVLSVVLNTKAECFNGRKRQTTAPCWPEALLRKQHHEGDAF